MFSGEGKLFVKSFPSPEDLRSNSSAPYTFQKPLKKGTYIPTDNLKYNHISVAKSLFSEVFEMRVGV